MADHPEVIRKQMEETRSDLEQKLEALENQVSETVQSTTEAVSETVDAVKETVENVTSTVKETVESVAQTFDLGLQTERHPWIVFGASVAAGCLVSQLFASQTRHAPYDERTREPEPTPQPETASNQRGWEKSTEFHRQLTAQAEPAQNGKKSWFGEELSRLKSLALGSLMGVVRDLAARGFPGPLGERIAQEVDHLNTAMGGESIQGPLLPSEKLN